MRQKLLGRAFQPIMEQVLKRADAIIVSSWKYAQSSPVLCSFQSRCRIIPHGIVHTRFQQQDEGQVEAIRKRFGPRIVLAVGRMVYYKGFEYLVRAMKAVDGTLLLIGTGPLHEALSAEIQDRGLQEKVHMLGDVPDDQLPNYYSAAELFVLPSVERSESFGIVQLEAMACGRPVINTQLESGVPYVSENGVTGIPSPPKM